VLLAPPEPMTLLAVPLHVTLVLTAKIAELIKPNV
jgi:hypothetical protein